MSAHSFGGSISTRYFPHSSWSGVFSIFNITVILLNFGYLRFYYLSESIWKPTFQCFWMSKKQVWWGYLYFPSLISIGMNFKTREIWDSVFPRGSAFYWCTFAGRKEGRKQGSPQCRLTWLPLPSREIIRRPFHSTRHAFLTCFVLANQGPEPKLLRGPLSSRARRAWILFWFYHRQSH